MDQPGIRRAKAARIEVEGRQVGLEIDVEPLASCGLGVLRGKAHGSSSYALELVSAAVVRNRPKSPSFSFLILHLSICFAPLNGGHDDK